MKATITLVTLVATLFSQLSFARARIPIPYGTKDKIVKMVDLPDQKEFQLEDGRFFDIGSFYTINHVVWLAYSSTKPQIVGFIDGDEYLVLSPDELKEIALFAKIELPAEAEISFMDKIGGKIILGIFGLLAIYGLYISYFGKSDEDEEVYDEFIPSSKVKN